MNMTYEIVRADGGMEAIIWIVLAIVWAVAQAITKSREKRYIKEQKKRTPPPPTGKLQSDLEEFFEELSQQQPQRPVPQPPPTQQNAPPPPVRRQVPKTPLHVLPQPQAQAPVRHVRKRQPPRPAPPPLKAPRPAPPVIRSISETDIRKIAVAEGMRASQKKIRMSLGKSLMLSSKSLKLPAMQVGTFSAKRTGAPSRAATLLHGRNALRDGYISRVVLGPPRGIQAPGFGPHDYGA